MKRGCLVFLLIVTCALAAPAAPPDPADGDPVLSGLFAKRGVIGTLIIESLDGELRISAREQAAYRVEIVRDALHAKGLLPEGKGSAGPQAK